MCPGVQLSSSWMNFFFEISHVQQWLKMVAWTNFAHVLILLVMIFWIHFEWCLLPFYLFEKLYWWALFLCSLVVLPPPQLVLGFPHVQLTHVLLLLTCLTSEKLSPSFITFFQPLAWCSPFVILFMHPSLVCVLPTYVMLLKKNLDGDVGLIYWHKLGH